VTLVSATFISVTEFIAIVSFGLAAGMTPGPNNTLLMISGANWGFRATLPHIFGIVTGFPLMMFIVGLGLGRVFIAYPVLHTILKYACFAWILFLAWKTWNASRPDAGGKKSAKPMGFFAAAAFQWVNPKAWIMAVGAMALFVPIGSNVFSGVLLVALGFFLVSIPSSVIWCLFGAAIARLLNSEKRARIFNAIMAILLVASVVPLLL
jgi:threonine/homoserine/homoserine lactone efflux protein